ncbi:hypothetical protein ACMAY7_11615 [Rhodobacteraceae bacterium nBUS_24]
MARFYLPMGGVSHNGLSLALNQQKTTKGPLGEILIAHSLSPEISVIKALAAQSGKAVADNSNSAKPFESDDPIYWITQAMMPWGKDGGHWQVANSDQSRFEKQRRAIEDKLGPASMVWASHAQIQARQQKLFGPQLARHAESLCPDREKLPRSSFHILAQGPALGRDGQPCGRGHSAHSIEGCASLVYPMPAADDV